MRMRTLVAALCVLFAVTDDAQAQQTRTYTRADTLRGSVTSAERVWWDVTFYDLRVRVSPADSSIRGSTGITYRVVEPHDVMQVDLMQPLAIHSVVQDGSALQFRRDGNAYFVTMRAPQQRGAQKSLTVYYGGRPTVAPRPPWDGGFSWQRDSLGRHWVVTTDQGVGASIWWPNKDTQADEPDSMSIRITVPKPMVHVGNGRLRSTTDNGDGTRTFNWFVSSPINNYAIAVNAGHYVHWSETYEGENGTLTLDYWPLDYNLEKSKVQFRQVKPMMKCFEHWFGPYPWYEDGFKLIDVPYPGMEHQSANTYGNGYANGYGGNDASGTGYGMLWDFIIVHEAAHEWWGNNITTRDLADMWVHEGFANYSESLYTECLFGKEAGAAYARGVRSGIGNDRPVVPPAYGVNAQGSGDMYPKGGNLLHTIRQLVDDDAKWRSILRGLNEAFRRQIVTGKQVQDYIARESGLELDEVFEQYLTTTRIPALEYDIADGMLRYRWADVVDGFDMPVDVTLTRGTFTRIRPTTSWQTAPIDAAAAASFEVDPDFYVTARRVAR